MAKYSHLDLNCCHFSPAISFLQQVCTSMVASQAIQSKACKTNYVIIHPLERNIIRRAQTNLLLPNSYTRNSSH